MNPFNFSEINIEKICETLIDISAGGSLYNDNCLIDAAKLMKEKVRNKLLRVFLIAVLSQSP